MCGILFTCSLSHLAGPPQHTSQLGQILQKLRAENSARGPDAQDSCNFDVDGSELSFFSSELHLRGNEHISQPHRNDNGHVLCWNGEILITENDGLKLFDLLRTTRSAEEFRDVLATIEGPYAIVYYHPILRRIFFARDPLGRRSLLIHLPNASNPSIILTSVSFGSHSLVAPEELSTDCIHFLDVDRLRTVTTPDAFVASMGRISRVAEGNISPFAESRKVNTSIPDNPPKTADLDNIPMHLLSSVDGLIAQLDRSVMLQTYNIPQSSDKGKARVAVLFSGGIDSTVLAFLAHRYVEPEEPIDLLNVAFENPRKILVKAEGNIGGLPKREKKAKLKDRLDYSTVNIQYDVPDRLTGRQEVTQVEIDVPYDESQAARPRVEALMFPGRTIMDLLRVLQ
ncbi:hypothetical protein EUX98_g2193 [Antrodiella citrinella]|uniref:Glutamine amidotransferase type-2 domain-containing protein n=1 Tax=Antrodiella citrinella TaxID=2447956 RepID=A0A4S4MZL7_9APHY|nr:hypothetical protein EUX98_g2193 [Antrodiella citrinella]